MRNVRSDQFEEFEEIWEDFLGHLERVWYKISAHFQRSPKWEAWAQPYWNLRKTDPLLAYLHHARGADFHSVEPITGRATGVPWDSLGRRMLDGADFSLGGDDGKTLIYKPTRVGTVHILRSHVQLLPVTHKNKSYPVPDSHLGKPINFPSPRGNVFSSLRVVNPIQIADLGLSFYTELVDRAESFFVDKLDADQV